MQCQVCKKTWMSGNNVSHSKRRTKTRFVANVHRQHLVLNGQSISAKLCTRCLRSLHKSPKILRALTAR